MKRILSVAVLLFGTMALNAAGTAVGTIIDNKATLSFDVGGVAQDTVDSNEDKFVVDRKIDVMIAINNSALDTQPGATAVKLNFEVANQGNDIETWTLSLAENLSDDFDVETLATCKLFHSGGAVIGTFPQDISFVVDDNKTFDVSCDMPTVNDGVNDGENAEIFLVATIKGRNNDAGVADDAGSTLADAQNVYAEGISDNADAAYDGKFSRGGTYHIVSTTIAFVKSSMVISDDLGSANPHRIPGAIVRYCFDIKNTGSATAEKVRLTEDLTLTSKENLNYVKSGIIIQTIGTCDCAAITDVTGTPTASATAIAIPEVATGIDIPSDKQACGYLEATIK